MVRSNTTSHVKASPGSLISWKEVAAIIDRVDAKGVPIPFALTFCTADEGAGTGGEIVSYTKAVKYVAGGRVYRGGDADPGETVLTDKNPKTRWLRKIRSVANVEIRNVHLHLILEINGHRVR